LTRREWACGGTATAAGYSRSWLRIISNSGWEQFAAAAAAARDTPWFNASRVARYAAAPLPPDHDTLLARRKPLDFDPLPYWARVTCPVLAFYAERDTNTPTARDVPLLISALKRAANTQYTVVVMPKTDHEFYEYPAPQRGTFEGSRPFSGMSRSTWTG
jgi:pimeloyl-ACP methyl ester carboxylesterase